MKKIFKLLLRLILLLIIIQTCFTAYVFIKGYRKYITRQPEIKSRLTALNKMITSPDTTGAYIKKSKHFKTPFYLQDPAQANKPSTIYDRNGLVIGRFIRKRQKIVRSLKKISPFVMKTLIAVEDRQFYQHNGINIRGIIRAALVNLKSFSKKQGGSTLTQQLAKILFTTREKTFVRKAFELFCTFYIEKSFSKKKILLMYLNTVNFGQSGGINKISYAYFKKSPAELNLMESSHLVAILPNPTLYSPYKHPERSRKRHRTVINVLVDREIIPATYAEREFEQHWQKFRENKQHLVTSFWKMQINKAPYAVESIRRQLAAVMTRQQITRGGLKIISSLDLRFNNTARAVTKKFLTTINAEQSNNNEKVECALVAIDNQTGGILSAVGGSGFSFANELIRYSQIRRPVGSLVKPFIYTFAAAELNYKPGTLVRDEPLKIKIPDGIWQPQNYDRKFMGKITMSTALMRSRNIPSVRTAGRLGVAKVKNFLCRAFAVENDRIPADLSIALGSCSLSPLEVVAAYSRFSSSKIDYFPFLIQNIFSNDVKLRQLPSKRRYKHNIATESVLEIIRKILIKVVNEKGGTAFRPMQQYGPSGITLAGKTGTTQDYRDVWFTAFTPRLSCTVWIGYDSNAKLDKVSGSRTAAPVVLSYLRRIYRHLPVKRFK